MEIQQKTKNGSITVTKVDGLITDVSSDFHIDKLFKIVHHLRTKLDNANPNKDVLNAMRKMGWPQDGI